MTSGGTLTGPGNLGILRNYYQYINDTAYSNKASGYDYFDITITPSAQNCKYRIISNCKGCQGPSNQLGHSLYLAASINGNYAVSGRVGSSSASSASQSMYSEPGGPDSHNHYWNASYPDMNVDFWHENGGSLAGLNIKITARLQGQVLYVNRSVDYDDDTRGKPCSSLQIFEYGPNP